MIIDTPGLRSFGLAHVDVGRVIHAFGDLEALTADCPRACSHDEEECALTGVLADDPSDELVERIASLRRLIRSRMDTPDEAEAD